MKRRHTLPFGAELVSDGVRFRLWAPDAAAVTLELDGAAALPMLRADEGWYELTTQEAKPGSLYRYRIGDGHYPDPGSRFQPDGVFGPSEVIDPVAYDWNDEGWPGIPTERAVLYELHPGAFSTPGDFAGIAEHLDHLVELGVTLVELLPVADCPGRWNWGYDGVLPFAPAGRYGRPEAMKLLVDACHARGLGVVLDVVYNHFGPEGNFLHSYAKGFFTERYKTPWGAAINVDGKHSAPVRLFFIENALYWLEEFHLDGLRFDAVHEIRDSGPRHFLEELGDRIRAELPGRPIHLFLENDRNDPALLGYGRGGKGPFDGQWNDDFHHALRVAVAGAKGGYYEDYRGDPIGRLGKSLAEGFSYQGEASGHRGGKLRGGASGDLPPSAFVNFIQNHDQVGNHAFGWRLPHFAEPEVLRAAAALLLLNPATPMLFMGEEWAATAPFPFFCDFSGDLAQAVRNGRLAEFASFPEFRDKAAQARIPDPLAESTFLSAKLDWDEAGTAQHARMLAHYRNLIALRQQHIAPLLTAGGSPDGKFERFDKFGLDVTWRLGGRVLRLVANLSGAAVSGRSLNGGTIFYRSHEGGDALPPWFVAAALAAS
jgi:malto-oligosyltrehalose trehalohydrolase